LKATTDYKFDHALVSSIGPYSWKGKGTGCSLASAEALLAQNGIASEPWGYFQGFMTSKANFGTMTAYFHSMVCGCA